MQSLLSNHNVTYKSDELQTFDILVMWSPVHAAHVLYMCYATSVSAELNYQQLSRLDRVVRVDTELLCC